MIHPSVLPGNIRRAAIFRSAIRNSVITKSVKWSSNRSRLRCQEPRNDALFRGLVRYLQILPCAITEQTPDRARSKKKKKKKIRRRKEKRGKKTVSFRQLAVSQLLSLIGLVISQLGKNDTDHGGLSSSCIMRSIDLYRSKSASPSQQ